MTFRKEFKVGYMQIVSQWGEWAVFEVISQYTNICLLSMNMARN